MDVFDNFFFGWFFIFEVFFYDVVVLFDGYFNYVGAYFFSFFFEVVWNFDNVLRCVEFFIFLDECFYGDEIDDVGEVFFGVDWDLERVRTRVEVFDNYVDGVEVVGIYVIYFVYEV